VNFLTLNSCDRFSGHNGTVSGFLPTTLYISCQFLALSILHCSSVIDVMSHSQLRVSLNKKIKKVFVLFRAIPEALCSATGTWPVSFPGEMDVRWQINLASTLMSALTQSGSATQGTRRVLQIKCTVISSIRHCSYSCWLRPCPQTELLISLLGKCTWTAYISKHIVLERQIKQRRFCIILCKAVKCDFFLWM
jgi:hypothetical protein